MDNHYSAAWMAIAVLALSAGIAISVHNYSDGKVSEAAVTKGLEECPNAKGSAGDTIWVKSCTEFLKSSGAYHGKD